jgi:hypothetical protein
VSPVPGKALNLSCERRYGVAFEPRYQPIRIGLTDTQLEPFIRANGSEEGGNFERQRMTIRRALFASTTRSIRSHRWRWPLGVLLAMFVVLFSTSV